MGTHPQTCASALASFESAASGITGYYLSQCSEIALPLEIETKLSEAWPDFESLDRDAWAWVRAAITRNCAGRLLTYAFRMANLAVRTSNESHVYHGFFALVIDESFLDYRDVCCVACALYDAALRVGGRPNDLVRNAARYAAPRRRDVLLGWLGGADYTKNLNSMGFEAVQGENGFEYRMLTFVEMEKRVDWKRVDLRTGPH